MNAMMRRVSLLAGALLAVAAMAWARDGKDFRWAKPINAGLVLEVKGINGEIVASASTGAAAEVVARKHGHHDDPDQVEIKVVEHAGGVTVCAIYPSDHERPNECQPGEGGRISSHDNDVEVDFEVSVPKGVRFTARTVNGGVEARGLSADVDARTVNGGVRLETEGAARAATVNGGIDAVVGSTEWKHGLEFETVNGSITVKLPAGVKAAVRAETVNGDIVTDFPLEVRGRLVGKKINGTIGGGGGDLETKTVNGSIRLLKR